jgi:hypothetical protein
MYANIKYIHKPYIYIKYTLKLAYVCAYQIYTQPS